MKRSFPAWFYIVIPLCILGFLFWYGWGRDFNNSVQTFVLKEGPTGDLGVTSRKAQLIERTFSIVNYGLKDVEISKIYSDCSCLSVLIPVGNDNLGPFGLPTEENSVPLKIYVFPGKEVKVKIIFNPSKIGTNKKSFIGNVFVETLDAKNIIRINLKALISD